MKNLREMKSIFRFIRFKNVKTRIEEYGYSYSLKQYLFVLVIEMLLVILLGKLNYLTMRGLIVLLCTVVIITPTIIIEQFRYLFEQSLFHLITEYMEQMLYAFSKHPKIISSLEEVYEASEGVLQEEVGSMIDALFSEEELSYEKVFRSFEAKYPCERMRVMHDFLIRVEQVGGEYHAPLFVLIEDLKLYKERVYLFQKERRSMRKKINLSMFSVLLLCTVLFRVLTQNDAMRTPLDGTGYQMASTLLFLCFFLLYVFAQVKLRGSWFGKAKEMKFEKMAKDWAHVREDPLQFPRAKARLEREANKKFPGWLRMMTLRLSSDNVYRALMESEKDAPEIMKQDMRHLLEDINEDPVSMKPYNRFLKELSVPEIQSTMKMIYAYTNSGTKDAQFQLNAIMQRNMVLSDKAERMENEDELAAYQFLFYAPMFLGTAKIMMDMSVLFVVMFQLWGNL
ncbi:MAG: hypothetical protein MJ087_05270 [Lachnospiraceae bacterium]|nr:hypothetical protein [Lachnospiraceae bacterium]